MTFHTRQGARLYVTTATLIGVDAECPPVPIGPRDVLTEAICRETGERSATEVPRRERSVF